jgi:hypothetical protein
MRVQHALIDVDHDEIGQCVVVERGEEHEVAARGRALERFGHAEAPIPCTA